jgi:hypothetical protein
MMAVRCFLQSSKLHFLLGEHVFFPSLPVGIGIIGIGILPTLI